MSTFSDKNMNEETTNRNSMNIKTLFLRIFNDFQRFSSILWVNKYLILQIHFCLTFMYFKGPVRTLFIYNKLFCSIFILTLCRIRCVGYSVGSGVGRVFVSLHSQFKIFLHWFTCWSLSALLAVTVNSEFHFWLVSPKICSISSEA